MHFLAKTQTNKSRKVANTFTRHEQRVGERIKICHDNPTPDTGGVRKSRLQKWKEERQQQCLEKEQSEKKK
jgi:hypothetical protein